jgi:hypothetical protein
MNIFLSILILVSVTGCKAANTLAKGTAREGVITRIEITRIGATTNDVTIMPDGQININPRK